MNKKVFLGGTCNDSTWRDALVPKLKIESYNPVVPNWTPECQEEERKQREECDFCLYVITPRMTGSFSIAEVVDDSNKRPNKTVFCILNEDDGYLPVTKINFTPVQRKSLVEVEKMVSKNGAKVFNSLDEIAEYLNASA
jgi:Nucleoside 2-deoxyribosyltransferase like